MTNPTYMRTDEDCLRAAVATLLRLPYEALPDVAPGPGAADAYERWGAERGLRMTVHPPHALPLDRDRWVALVRVPAPPGGRQAASRDGFNRHALVMCRDELHFDPIPYRDEGHDVLLCQAETTAGVTFERVEDLRGELDRAAGVLTGKALPVGGTWTFLFGDTDDYTVETTGKTAQRTTVSDTDARAVTAGTTSFGAVLVQTDLKLSSIPAPTVDLRVGVIARATDNANNASVYLTDIGPDLGLLARVRVAAATTDIGSSLVPTLAADTWYTLRALYDAAGRVFVWWFPTGSQPGAPLFSAQHADLATGGALASGMVGIHDKWALPTALTRNYDNFLVATPAKDAAIFASQSLEIRYDRVIREDSAGAIWTPASSHEGDLLTVPAAWEENRDVEFFVSACRNDPYTMADPAIDDISARLSVAPRGLVVPES